MSKNNLSKLAKEFEGDTCAKFDQLLESADTEELNTVRAWARAWNAQRCSKWDIPEDIRDAALELALAL